MVTHEHIRAFLDRPVGRENNDRSNKLREEFVAVILSADSHERDSLKRAVRDKASFDEIVIELDRAVGTLPNINPYLIGFELDFVERRGGRTNNFDFEFVFSSGSETRKASVEFKNGDSIFDQPQFLSLYVNAPGVTSQGFPTYAEYFYDRYFQELVAISSCPAVTRENYLKHLYGTKYTEPPFDHLYRFAKVNEDNRKKLAELQHRSIDAYLQILIDTTNVIDFSSLQERLYLQLDKTFLSWSINSRSFVWERFTKEELTLSKTLKAKKKSNGQISTVVLPTQTGQQIQMLLRWKNNPCVKGPAWQVKLTPG